MVSNDGEHVSFLVSHSQWLNASLKADIPLPARRPSGPQLLPLLREGRDSPQLMGRCEDREKSGQLALGTWPGV